MHGTSRDQKNLITPNGFKKLQEEFARLKHEDRPKIVETVSWAASNGDRSENGDYIYGKKKLREIDKRLQFLSARIKQAEVIDPSTINSDRVSFGATVRVLNEDDEEIVYSIVGVDESEPSIGLISWLSPIAKALNNSKAGDLVSYQAPSGERDLEVLSVSYEPQRSPEEPKGNAGLESE
jgi:transcription elongation factor GreB